MDITLVNNVYKVCEIKLNSNDELEEIYEDKIINNNTGRVYIIVSNNEIMKIGVSMADGGIKKTIYSYVNGDKGKPSLRSFGINFLIKNELKMGKRVEFYHLILTNIFTNVPGLFDEEVLECCFFKESEKKCLNDFYQIENKYPLWNLQENHEKWNDEIRKQYIDLINQY